MPRNPQAKCDLSWEKRYGTTSSGNLSQYKRTECIENTIDINAIHAGGADWVSIHDFHYYHIKCPYSNEADLHYVRNTDRASANYWQLEEVMPADRTNHTATGGLMIRYARGTKYGWLCVDPNCSFFLNNGYRYFYL